MSIGSALLGDPPANANDQLVQRGLHLIVGSEINPNKSQPYGEPRPPGYVFDSWSTSMIVGVSFGMLFATGFTLARLFVRKVYTQKIGADDIMIIPGLLGCLVYLTSIIVQCSAGCLGNHIWDCTYAQMGNFFTWETVNDPIFFFTVFCVKLSIALQNRRMTLMAGRNWQIVHWTFIIAFLIALPVLTIVNMVQCVPISTNYSLQALAALPDRSSIHCVNKTSLSYAGRALHIITDVALLCVPIAIVVRLQMAWRKKARLVAIFALGGMSVIAGIIRNTSFNSSIDDITYRSKILYIWNIIDLVFGMVVANLPALNIMVDVSYDKIKTYYGDSKQSSDLTPGSHGSFFLRGGRSARRRQLITEYSISMTNLSQEPTIADSIPEQTKAFDKEDQNSIEQWTRRGHVEGVL